MKEFEKRKEKTEKELLNEISELKRKLRLEKDLTKKSILKRELRDLEDEYDRRFSRGSEMEKR